MSQVIAELRHEHDVILSALAILERMATRAERGQLPAEAAGELLDFLRAFVDQCHHGKEEALLFPALIAAGLAEHGGFVDELHAEHVQGRALVQAMAQACGNGRPGGEFAALATTYATQLRAHIDKENAALFSMTERLLDEPILAELQQAFAAHEEKVMGHGRHAQLHAQLQRLAAQYPG
ncbi:hemerythrin domain-containing protein [Pseudomonas stutzeri]|nr:hemerythrin domain-containing protein [Stutzerimonas stutzeri]